MTNLKSNSTNTKFDFAVIGNWHLSYVTSAVLSSVGHKVALVNHQPPTNTQGSASYPECPVHEPGIKEMVQKGLSENNLTYLESFSGWSAKYIWMAVDTPVNEKDEPNLEPLWQVIQATKNQHADIRAFVISSQIPMGFCKSVYDKYKLPLVYIPENLRLGKGIETFRDADRTVIGSDNEDLAHEISEQLSKFKTEFLICNLVSSEMIKHATNAFLATSISFANELARVGECYGVDGQIVAKALKMDKRIGPMAYVAPGLGFAGGTLPRDLRVLQRLGSENKIPTPLVDSVLTVNNQTTVAIVEMVKKRLTSKKQKVLILGYTYKADTDTLRRSMSVEAAELLTNEGYEVLGFDPMMNAKDISSFGKNIKHFDNIQDITSAPEVLLVMTGRPAFKEINWNNLSELWSIRKSETRPLIFDTQNIIDGPRSLKSGFDFKRLWSSLQKGIL